MQCFACAHSYTHELRFRRPHITAAVCGTSYCGDSPWQQCCPPQGVARRQSVRLLAVAVAEVVAVDVAVAVAVAVAAVHPSHANLAT